RAWRRDRRGVKVVGNIVGCPSVTGKGSIADRWYRGRPKSRTGSKSAETPCENGLLGVQPVLRLVEHDRLRSIDDLVSHFLAAVSWEAMHEERFRLGLLHQRAVH